MSLVFAFVCVCAMVRLSPARVFAGGKIVAHEGRFYPQMSQMAQIGLSEEGHSGRADVDGELRGAGAACGVHAAEGLFAALRMTCKCAAMRLGLRGVSEVDGG